MENEKQNTITSVGGFKAGEMAVVMASVKDEITPDAVTLNGVTYYREGVETDKVKTALLVRPLEPATVEEEPFGVHGFREAAHDLRRRARESFHETRMGQSGYRNRGYFGGRFGCIPGRIGCQEDYRGRQEREPCCRCCGTPVPGCGFRGRVPVGENPFRQRRLNNESSLANTTGVTELVLMVEEVMKDKLEEFKQFLATQQCLYSAKHMVPEVKPNQEQDKVLTEWAEYMMRKNDINRF